VYREQLFANEVMLLPYYIASLNIEHAYYELTGTYDHSKDCASWIRLTWQSASSFTCT